MELMTERRHLAEIVSRPGITLHQVYQLVLEIPGTIDQHLVELRNLGARCSTVLELGSGMSTVGWLAAGCRVTSVDVDPMPWAERLTEIADNRLTFVQQSSLIFTPQSTDLLFIDTLHTAEQLAAELDRHGELAGSKIVLHDTESFGRPDSPLTQRYHPGDPGLLSAIRDWLAEHKEWHASAHYKHQHGLTVLSRSKEHG